MDELQEQQQIKKRRGCFFYGCLIGCFLVLLVLLGGLLGLRYAKKMFSDFTDDKPVALPVATMPPAQMEQVRKRVDDFRNSVKAGTTPAPLELNSDELNALIATDDDLRGLKGKLYVNAIEGNQIKGQVSIPMDEAGLPVFKNRFLNGTATFHLSLRNGLIRLIAQDITVKQKPIPDIYMQKIRTQNLAKSVNSDPRVSVALDWIENLEVKDGKLVIVPKAKPPR
jgi:hypothetical protein